ncbi:TPA: hypothetical protein EYO12_02505 [Candidatus Saccharibacteria bacterium]|nr:hypothetical protein [Candidatus Saccharibacteria bacterium]HIO87627.1 hypothetical protein [Candidatus Saccharibacteria bacterium]
MLNKVKSVVGKKTEDTHEYIVALDVGTEFVKALIGKVEDDRIEVVGVGRQHQKLSDMHSGAIADIAGVVENCEKALQKAEDMAEASPRSAVLGLAGELVKGGTTTIKYRRKDAKTALEIEELEGIMQKIRDRAAARTRAQLAWESGNKELEIRLVNSALVNVNVDGYKVTNPIGFQGGDVAIQLFTAFAPMVHIGALERVSDELDLALLSLSAEPYAVARSVTKSEADNNFSAILIDVGGGTTDIAVVNDGGVEGTKMFGIGGRSFTNAIAHEFDIDFEKAEAMKLRSNQVEEKSKTANRVNEALEQVLDVWIDGVVLALSEFDSLDHLPPRVLLCGGGAGLKPLLKRLNSQDWHNDLPFTRQPVVKLINPDEVTDVVDATGQVKDHTMITAMGLLKIGYDTLQTTDTNQTWRDKLNALLRV